MSYHFSKTLKGTEFDAAIGRVTEALKAEGFGVLMELDIKDTLKKKIDVDFRRYKILGACNPKFAHRALTAEDKIGVFLPCNVVVQEQEGGAIEVSAVDPVASMLAVKNDGLAEVALEVQMRLKRVIEGL